MEPEQQDPNVDDFDAAWDEATDVPLDPSDEEGGDGGEGEAPGETDRPGEAEPTEQDSSAPEGRPSAPEDDLQTRFASLQQAYQTLEGRYRADRERWQQQAGSSSTQPQSQTPPSDGDEEFLAQFRKTYNDDVIRAIDLLAGRRAQTIVSEQLSRFAPVEQNVETVLEQLHFQTIESVHPDVHEIDESPEFEAWINSRPVHTRAAYARVREEGSPQEVIALLDEYKEFTQPKSRTSVPESRVNSATAVRNRRGVLPTRAGPDQNDFDAAWEEATSSMR